MKHRKTSTSPPSEEKGFTLVEVLIAIVILAIVALGIMSLLPTGYRHITSAGRISTLNHIGQMKIDQLRATSFSDLDLQAGIHPSTGAGETYPEMYAGSEFTNQYTVYWVVSDNVPQPGMKRVVVTVGHTQFDETGTLIEQKDTKDQRIASFSTYLTQ